MSALLFQLTLCHGNSSISDKTERICKNIHSKIYQIVTCARFQQLKRKLKDCFLIILH